MNFIKRKIADMHLRKLFAKERFPINKSLNDAESILVILPCDEAKRLEAIKWVDRLKVDFGIPTVESLYFANRKPKKDEKVSKNQLNKTHLNWYSKPVRGHIIKLTEKTYDLLIDLEAANWTALQFITLETDAKMRVGRRSKFKEPYLDMMIDTDNNQSIGVLLEQIEKYLSIFEDKVTV
ncbi:MAG: hypothetical protein CL843_01250 [Crocinitomicaceae bacterium]|nr:hypothetical protein [Crocinitomicaceae bacterium]